MILASQVVRSSVKISLCLFWGLINGMPKVWATENLSIQKPNVITLFENQSNKGAQDPMQGDASEIGTSPEASAQGNQQMDTRLDAPFNREEMVLEVKSKKKLIQKSSSVSSTFIRKEQISQLPQGSEISLPKLLTITTPGSVQGPFGQTFFRGNHANIQYQIDGVQLPESPSNTFGQAISPRNIESMEVITGGIPAEYGQRLGAVVNIISKSGQEVNAGEIELNYGSYNTFSPHLLYSGSNEIGNLHYFFSANYFYTDRGIDTPQPATIHQVDQGGVDSVHNNAQGNSQFLRLDWLNDNQNKVLFIFSHSHNKYQIPNFPSSFNAADPLFQNGYSDPFGNDGFVYRPSHTNDWQAETNLYSQVVWRHSFDSKTFMQIAPYYKYSTIRVEWDPENDLSAPWTNPTAFSQNRKIHNIGLKGDYSQRWLDRHLIKSGFQVQASDTQGKVSIQKNLNQSPSSVGTPGQGYFQSIYLQDDFTIAKPLILNAGLRFDATQFSFGGLNSSDQMLQPRVGLNYMATDTTKLHVFYGKLFQPAPVESLRYEYSDNTNAFVPLQYYDIKAEKDDFYEAGISQQFLQNQVAKWTIYYKNGKNILDDIQLLNTSIAQPYNFARGYAYGTELSVRGQLSEDWSEFSNYSYQIAKGKGVSGGIWSGATPSEDYQFLDHTQVHTLTAGITYSKNSLWWTTQGLYGSGLRSGPGNSRNLPGHFTMDTSIGYVFDKKSVFPQMRISADLLNIFNNVYPITIANGYSGTHYAAGRQFFIRLAKEI